MNLRPRLTAAAALAVALALLAGCGRAPEPTGDPAPDTGAPIRVTEARIRAVIPGQDKTAAYFTIENRGRTPFVLAGVESTQARAIEIHTIERDGDMARMRRLPQVAVEPGAHVQFAPGLSENQRMLLFDPQTSGGLLLCVPEEKHAELLEAARQADQPLWTVGEVIEGSGIEVV